MWIKSAFTLRSKNHLFSRLQIKDEKSHAYRLIPWLALVNISFGFVDWFVRPNGPVLIFFGVRILAVLISRALYLFSRGRTRYGIRLFFTVAPYMFAVEFIMLTQNLIVTPYFAGLALVMVTSAMLFPVRFKISAIVYTVTILPVLTWLYKNPTYYTQSDLLVLVLMLFGSVLVCAVNSGQVHEDLKIKLSIKETLTRDLGKREKEIRAKAEELVKRQIFESQFSPQVVSAILKDRALAHEMQRLHIVNIVIDIEDSTVKAHSLHPSAYKEVVEEVLDVFAASCMKWNVTLDKFTGDGVQAFSGAPVANKDDFYRAVMACRDTIRMLWARKSAIELIWKSPLNVRFAICEGEALVGFIGRGIFKSYTAVGDMVSFTHRLGSVPKPWTIAACSWYRPIFSQTLFPGIEEAKTQAVSGLKGFGDQSFQVTFLSCQLEEQSMDTGRCPQCSTPLVFEDGPGGLPRIYCAACESRTKAAA